MYKMDSVLTEMLAFYEQKYREDHPGAAIDRTGITKAFLMAFQSLGLARLGEDAGGGFIWKATDKLVGELGPAAKFLQSNSDQS